MTQISFFLLPFFLHAYLQSSVCSCAPDIGMGVWFASKSLRTSPIVRFKMVDHLNTQKMSKFSAWEILSKRLDVSPETWWKCRRPREHLIPADSGLLRVTSGHLHLLSLVFPSWHLVLEGSGSQERGRRYYTPCHSQHPLVLGLNIVFQSSCQTSSMEEEELENISRFPVGHQILSGKGHEILKEQGPPGFLLVYK